MQIVCPKTQFITLASIENSRIIYSYWETTSASQNHQKNIVIYFWLCSVIKKNTTKNLCSIEGKATFIIELIFHQNAALYEKQ